MTSSPYGVVVAGITSHPVAMQSALTAIADVRDRVVLDSSGAGIGTILKTSQKLSNEVQKALSTIC